MAKRSKRDSGGVRRAAAPSAPRESSPALVIALVFMVLVSLILGVMLYMDKDKLKQADETTKAAEDKAKKATDQYADDIGYLEAKLPSWVNQDGVNEEQRAKIIAYEKDNKAAAGLMAKWLPLLQEKVEGNPKGKTEQDQVGLIGPYQSVTGRAATSLETRIRNLETELANTREKYQEADKNLKTVTANLETYKKQHNDTTEREAVLKARTELEEKYKENLAKKDGVIEEYKKKYDDLNREFAGTIADIEKKFNKEIADIKKDHEDTKAALHKKYKEDTEKYKVTKVRYLTEPRGEVTQSTRDGQLIHVNIGSAQRLKPQVPFTVYQKGPGGKALPEPKAKIEIITVEGPKQALARVTAMAKRESARPPDVDHSSEKFWITDPRDFWRSPNPIQRGDMLYNPVWDPDNRVRVFLAGIFDLDGDGRDDLETFKRILMEMGAEVVGELNSKGETRGRLDYQTDYLVIGGILIDSPTALTSEEAEVSPVRGVLGVEADKLMKSADDKGIEKISLRRFLAEMGYSHLRVPTRRIGTVPPPAVNGNGKEPPKEEAPKEEAPKEEAPKEEAPKEEAPRKEAPKKEAPKKVAPEKEAPDE